MINKPVTQSQVMEITKENPFFSKFPNRADRRKRVTKRNMLRQVVNNILTGPSVTWHPKPSNLPYQYLGMSRIKNSNKS
jgi:hypothetical protein